LISCGLYLAACVLPATVRWQQSLGGGPDRYETIMGLNCLLFGWLGEVAWLANPFALIAAILLIFRRPTGAASFGAASLIVAQLYVLVPPGESDHPDLPRLGAWLWSGSFLALTIAAMIRRGWPTEAGHAPNRDELLARHPELAEFCPPESQVDRVAERP
jgi:hypothetical protein